MHNETLTKGDTSCVSAFIESNNLLGYAQGNSYQRSISCVLLCLGPNMALNV